MQVYSLQTFVYTPPTPQFQISRNNTASQKQMHAYTVYATVVDCSELHCSFRLAHRKTPRITLGSETANRQHTVGFQNTS